MKANSKHPISMKECFLDTIPVVDINVEVEDPRVGLKQLEYAEHNIVNVAKTTRLCLFGVMVAS